jgi:hypothetical protein
LTHRENPASQSFLFQTLQVVPPTPRLTNVVVEDGYNLLARAGRQVQEIHVVTGLDRDAIKRAIKRATSALK